jgi:formylglycine-generating enzyme required for sulfatase activity
MDWEAEGRVPARNAAVAAFDIDVYEITESAYGQCRSDGRCGEVALSGEPGRALTGLTRAEARTYCEARAGRLPTEDEWMWAAAGASSRRYPWGDTGAVCRRGAWGIRSGPCGYGASGPEIAGTHPDGASPQGVQDLAGNAAEWVEAAEGGLAHGGSWASGFAAELRTWYARPLPDAERSVEIGARCVYDVHQLP